MKMRFKLRSGLSKQKWWKKATFYISIGEVNIVRIKLHCKNKSFAEEAVFCHCGVLRVLYIRTCVCFCLFVCVCTLLFMCIRIGL